MMKDTSVIIAAGGKGKRMGCPKQLLKIGGQEILVRTILAFKKVKRVKEIIVVTTPETFKVVSKKIKGLKFAQAGKERIESVKSGLKEVSKDIDLIAVQDGARPLVNPKDIEVCLSTAKKDKAAVLGVFVKDTIKKVKCGKIIKTLKRGELFAAQTPQCYRAEILKSALKKYGKEILATDESQLVEKLGISITAVIGDYKNIKITTPEDLIIAGALCQKKK
ncbi:MAG: 2-C-methyl-D-erythritol 4-phosphate cytidylyltransferase [Elusimicrobiaceae bacterium]|nr:2-C-methyl-D-erythritol 4-phosphate cytidylyltransferase [Elusimicrobiaceae bacterium]